MTRYLFLFSAFLVLAGCSQQRFGFRKTVAVQHDPATSKNTEQTQGTHEPEVTADAAVDERTVTIGITAEAPHTLPVDVPVVKDGPEVVPVVPKESVQEENHSEPHLNEEPEPSDKNAAGLIAFVLALGGGVLLSMAYFHNNKAVGFVQAAFGATALALFLSIFSRVRPNKRKGFAKAAMILALILLFLCTTIGLFLIMKDGNTSQP